MGEGKDSQQAEEARQSQEIKNPPEPERMKNGAADFSTGGRSYIMSQKTPRVKSLPEYWVWHGMIQRCTNPRYPGYHYWGGRGITVCERWRKSFADFRSDMGPRPGPALSLDRIDNDGNYKPGNCRWATWSEQMRNRRPPESKTMVTLNGTRRSLRWWCHQYGMKNHTVWYRIKRGWSVRRALETPPQQKHLRRT